MIIPGVLSGNRARFEKVLGILWVCNPLKLQSLGGIGSVSIRCQVLATDPSQGARSDGFMTR